MPLTFLAATQSAAGDTFSSSKTVPIPAGTSANSVVVCVMQMASPTATVTTVPSGFAPVSGSPFTITGVSGGENYAVYWKRSASGEGSGNYSWGFSTTTWNMIEAFAIDGCRVTGNPFEDVQQSVSTTSTGVPNLTVTTTANDLLVLIGLADANTSGTDWNPPTSPGTFTEVIDNNYNGISWYQDTASGSRTVSGGTISASRIHAQMLMAFVPEASGTDLTQTATDGRGLADVPSFDVTMVLNENRGLVDSSTPDLTPGGSPGGLVFTRLVVT